MRGPLRGRNFGFVGFCQLREHFLFIMVCLSLMNGLTENNAWSKTWTDLHFTLKKSQPFRRMVSKLVSNKKFHVVFSSPSCSWSLSKLARPLLQIQLVLSGIFMFFFNQEGIACYKIIKLGIVAEVFLFWV